MSSKSVLFRDLKRFVAEQQQRLQPKQFTIFRGLPFYRWDISEEEHRRLAARSNNTCCFNHQISLPEKNGVEHPLYDYERNVFDTLFKEDCSANSKHIWIKKATGLGITELLLRIIVYLCLKDDKLSGSQIVIFTGPRIDLAIDLIGRLKRLFYSKNLITSFATKETVVVINNVKIEAFPSHHVDSARGLPNVSFIFLDESDYFPPGQQQDARNVSERYIAKSNPWIVLVSTPNAPDGLFERIEKESEDTCLYKQIFLDYTYGIGKIYTAEEIEKAKQSPSFEREYNLKYLGKIGNVFHTKDIELALEKGKKYNPDNFNPLYSSFTSKSMGIDPGYGSSAFGVVVTQWADDHIQVLHAEEYHRPDYDEMLLTVYGLISKYQIDKTYIDGANPSFIRSLKLQIGEDPEYNKVIARYKSEGFAPENALKDMKVVPVSFGKEHKSMLGHCKMILENDGGHIAINPVFDKLITSLRTAVDNDGTLDKESTSYNDIFDAFRLALKFYQFKEV